MSMRVTQNNMFNNAQFYMQAQQRDYDKLYQQLATGKKIQRPSDDPVTSARVLGFKTDLKELAKYQENVKNGIDQLNQYDVVLDRGTQIAKRARTLAIQGGNDTLAQSDRDQISREINQLLEEAVTTANTKFEGKYIFGGGQQLDTPFNGDPFKITRDTNGDITAVDFTGNKAPVLREYSESQNVQVNIFGDEAFQAQNEVVTSAGTITNSSGNPVTIQNAARELDVYLPSSPTEGYFRINGTDIYYDKDGNGLTSAGDSLLDIADRITASEAGVTARVVGDLVGFAAFADTTTAIGFAPAANGDNTIAVNGVDIEFNTNDSLDDIVTRLNNVTSQTNVTASTVQDAAGQYHIMLSGGVEIDDVAVPPMAGVFTTMGITTSDQAGISYPNNLIQTVTSSRSVSDPTALLTTQFAGVVLGNININGNDIAVGAGDTLNSLAAAIDALAGVTSYVDSNNQLVIAGASISVDSTAPAPPAGVISNIFDQNRLGIVNAVGQFIGTNGPQYQLQMTSNNPGQIAIEDINGGKFFSQDLMMTDELETPANNYTNQATVDRISLFESLIRLRDDLRTGGSAMDDVRGRDIVYFDDYINNAGGQRAVIGSRINRLEEANDRLAKTNIAMTDALSRIEDVDLAEVVTNLQKQSTISQASMAAASRIMQTSLLDFL